MKKLFIILLFLSTRVLAFQSDTTIVEFEDKSILKKIKITSPQGETFIYPRNLSLKNVLKALNVDSLERERAWVLVSKGKNSQDTLIVVNKVGNKVTITSRDLSGNVTFNDDEEIKTYESKDKRDFDVTISTDGGGGIWPKKNYSSSGRFFSKSDFAIYLGFNSYTNQADVAPNALSELRVWPSRYIAFSFRRNATLSNTEKSHLVLSYGPEFAWHNFMLINSNVLEYENGQASFIASDQKTSKSKFVVPHLNLPVMLNIGLKKEKIRLGIGGYVGYRIGGYTKVKLAENNRKERDNGSLGLESLKYGLTAELGKKNGGALFIRYDLSNLFRENQIHARDMQAFSFGFRL